MDQRGRELERKVLRPLDSAVGKPASWRRLREWLRDPDRAAVIGAVFVCQVLPAGWVAFVAAVAGPELAGTALALLWLGTLLMSGARVQMSLFAAVDEEPVWSYLPLSDGEVFDWRWWRFRRRFRERIVGAFLTGWVLLGYPVGFVPCLGLIFFAVLYWQLANVLTLLTANYLPSLRSWFIGLALVAGACGLLAIWDYDRRWLTESIASQVNTLVPTAWPIQLLLWFREGAGGSLWPAVPVAALLILGGPLYRRLRGRYRYEEPAPLEGAKGFWEHLEHAIGGRIPDKLESRISKWELQGPWVYQFVFGFVERTIQRWLTERERLLLEAFGSIPLGFTTAWRHAWYLLLAAMIPMAWLDPESGLPLLIGFAVALLLVPFGCSGHALTANARCGSGSGTGPLMVGGFPVALTELLRLAWKGCAIRTLLTLPQLLVFGMFCVLVMDGFFDGHQRDWQWYLSACRFGVEMAVEFAAIILISFPFFWMSGFACLQSNQRRSSRIAFVDLAVLATVFTISAVLVVVVLFSSRVVLTMAGLSGIAVLLGLGTLYLWRCHEQGDLIGDELEIG